MSIDLHSIKQAQLELKDIILHTPLEYNLYLSQQYDADIYLKREDQQKVRSYKLRGAFHKINALSASEKQAGVVCASAGNHAQGVAFACSLLQIQAKIFMPTTTPIQKINQVEMFGGAFVDVIIKGDTFDDAATFSIKYSQDTGASIIPPFEDEKIIEGQATVGLEILEDMPTPPDCIIVPIGGGGLAAGMSIVCRETSYSGKIIGVEPTGAPSMYQSIKEGRVVTLDTIDKFVDGAAVKKVGQINFDICASYLEKIVLIDEGEICDTILELYNRLAIVAEPAGALSVAALNHIKKDIVGKKVVCIVSGGNNDITRMEEIKERAIMYKGLKHYFIITFPQRPGALREFVVDILGPTDDITHFEYMKKNNRTFGEAIVGIELKNKEDIHPLLEKLEKRGYLEKHLNKHPELLRLLV